MGAAERLVPLVRDRFAEFQRLAQARGALSAQGPAGSRGLSGSSFVGDGTKSSPFGSQAAQPSVPEANSFMREFFGCVRELQGLLDKGRENVKDMGVILGEALQATTQEREAEVSEKLNKLVEETSQEVADVKRGLEVLKIRSEEEAAKQPNTAQIKIRTNMQQAMAKKHQQLLMDFQKAQMDFKRTLEQRQLREMQILMPEATEEQRQEMVSEGQTVALMVAQKMAGTHALLLDEVRRIQDKHKDILRLEQSIADLAQMFEEMAVLVDAQGEVLDAIEVHVNNTKGYTAKAEKELHKTRKLMLQGRKWMCCLSIFLLIVLLVILGPILIR
ncbi:unnamed protein product [Effrenium voratum]|uniref:t-SNARE coiled-coil homology domain-containing protein n=1 Tax=Effrenium voratum TaxID=2562239 RepID=A0AA36JHB2_9DINO|nr:unnamed protein product [Effrenium voratum]CAJ1451889.1 unnamed protein product [Effrenium voratum]